jgi:hypothetical protein
MAYITADEVSAIRTALKERFPQFKFGARKSSGSLGVDVTIKSGTIDFVGNYNETVSQRPGDFRGGSPAENYLQINQFWFQEHFSGDAKEVIDEVLCIIKTASNRKWYDQSDAMTDYFDTAFYIHLQVGAWNKPYALMK